MDVPDNDEKLPEKIEWYDLVYGLIQTDNKISGGENRELIMNEFKRTGFPVTRIKLSEAEEK